MKILVLGGTRFFGIHMVGGLLRRGHEVTIATRGRAEDDFGSRVQRICVERTDDESLRNAFQNEYYDVVCDDLAYCSNDVRLLLDVIRCGRYIMLSSTAVYKKHPDTVESDFDPLCYPLKWCSRGDYPYDEIKRQAECAMFQAYPAVKAIAARFPFGIGEDDYTKRLYFYAEHVVKEIPMLIDNFDAQMGFIRSAEAGGFLAWLAEQDFTGAINGSNVGTLSLGDMIAYVERKAGKKAICSPDGDAAPYNGEVEYSIDTTLANTLGYYFMPLKSWIYTLLDTYIEKAGK